MPEYLQLRSVYEDIAAEHKLNTYVAIGIQEISPIKEKWAEIHDFYPLYEDC